MVNPIKKPVGLKGKNEFEDVLIIQTLLYAFFTPPEIGDPPVPITGQFDGQTFHALWTFQSMVLGKPDGTVDPGGTTWLRLLEAITLDLHPLPNPGFGYYHYSDGSRQWGTMKCIDTLVSACREVRNQKSDVLIGIGDISWRIGGKMAPHDSHRKGTNIDIRPVRKDRLQKGVVYTSEDYDRENTQLLVDCLRATGNVRSILFNDNKIKGVVSEPDHDDHLHVTIKV
jgi:hypothetical protein